MDRPEGPDFNTVPSGRSNPYGKLKSMVQKALISECLRQQTWAVVGFSKHPHKYGHTIHQDLIRLGRKVYPVNLRGGSYRGSRIYRSVLELPEIPGVVDIVTPPRQTEAVVRECAEAGIERVWMQPGAESPKAIHSCQEAGLKVVHDACVMVEYRASQEGRGWRDSRIGTETR